MTASDWICITIVGLLSTGTILTGWLLLTDFVQLVREARKSLRFGLRSTMIALAVLSASFALLRANGETGSPLAFMIAGGVVALLVSCVTALTAFALVDVRWAFSRGRRPKRPASDDNQPR